MRLLPHLQPIARRLSRRSRAVTYWRVPRDVVALGDRVAELAREEKWDEALSTARQAADLAEKSGSPKAMRIIGGKLMRLGDVGRGLRLLAEPSRRWQTLAREWKGEDLAGRTLYVRQLHTSNMGGPIRLARFLCYARDKGARCIVVEERLVPIFRRTFPFAEVRHVRFDRRLPGSRRTDLVTSFEGLAGAQLTNWDSVARAPLAPLKADDRLTDTLRGRYRQGSDRPLIGITWGSLNPFKETPAPDDWADLLDAIPATFVSLQYGDVSDALRRLRRGDRSKLIHDPAVDQMTDMDTFAAQVAAMDVVIGINNTALHLAGAMDRPAVILGDAKFRGEYIATGTSSYWYPRTHILRRQDRPWPAVFREAAALLQAMAQ